LSCVNDPVIFAATHNRTAGDEKMFGSYALEMLALVVAVGGLVAVIAEIIVKDPSALLEIGTDVRAMAQPAQHVRTAANVSNGNFRKAA
jgi:hypothetical protein